MLLFTWLASSQAEVAAPWHRWAGLSCFHMLGWQGDIGRRGGEHLIPCTESTGKGSTVPAPGVPSFLGQHREGGQMTEQTSGLLLCHGEAKSKWQPCTFVVVQRDHQLFFKKETGKSLCSAEIREVDEKWACVSLAKIGVRNCLMETLQPGFSFYSRNFRAFYWDLGLTAVKLCLCGLYGSVWYCVQWDRCSLVALIPKWWLFCAPEDTCL